MADIRINMHSDTQSRPTPGMKEAMMAAELGGRAVDDGPHDHQTR